MKRVAGVLAWIHHMSDRSSIWLRRIVMIG